MSLDIASRKSSAGLITRWKAPGKPARGFGAAEAITAPYLRNRILNSGLRWVLIVALAGMLAGCTSAGVGTAERTVPADFRRQFLTFCDLATKELNKEISVFGDRENADPRTHHMPSFEDAHAARGLTVAYDMTHEQRYLDACKLWADRMIAYQDKMIPRGIYYMNHGRAPGESQGHWNVADCGTIGMGILATAARCDDPAVKAKYVNSVRRFAKLVIDRWVTKEGGICNGYWPVYDGPWWCSSATFGAMAFMLYEETHDEQYLTVARGALDWLIAQDFRSLSPITFDRRPSGTIFYCFDLYATGFKYIKPGSPQYDALIRQLDVAFAWMARNQKSRGAAVPDYTVKNVDMAGLPSLMYFFARKIPRYRNLTAAADGELDYIGRLLLAHGEPRVSYLLTWEVMTWGMMSYAEKLLPGALHRASRPRP